MEVTWLKNTHKQKHKVGGKKSSFNKLSNKWTTEKELEKKNTILTIMAIFIPRLLLYAESYNNNNKLHERLSVREKWLRLCI